MSVRSASVGIALACACAWAGGQVLPLAPAGSAAAAKVPGGKGQDLTPSSAAPPAIRIDADHWTLSPASLAFLQRVAAVRDPAVSRTAVAASALEDHVLGGHAQRTVGDEALYDNGRVALSPEASAEASLDASLWVAFRAPLTAALGPDGGAHFVTARPPLPRERLLAVLGMSSPATRGASAAPAIRLDDRLAPEREAALGDVTLLAYRFDDGSTGTITLQEVWRHLTLQQRHLLYGGDTAFATAQATERLRHRFARHWAAQHAGLPEDELSRLQALFADHERRAALARWLGVTDDGSFHSAALDRLRAAVTPDEVARYYAAHPDDFTRVERVRARHIHCADEARAQAAATALARGEPFADVARRASDAPDRLRGGDLGWLDAAHSLDDWLTQVAFAQPVGAPTSPLRAPSGGWEIVQVQDRVTGHHPVDSETVRYAAGVAIAREHAAADYAALRARLLGATVVAFDPAQAGTDAAGWRARGFK